MSTREHSQRIELAQEPNFTLGPMQVRPSAREVFVGSEREVLEPRVMQVLVALARRKGEVVSRTALVEECWAGRIVGEDAIGRCIAKVRRLTETHGGLRVETIARVGYRLSETPDARNSAALPQESHVPVVPYAPAADTFQLRDGRRSVLVVLALVAASLAAVSLGWWQWHRMEAARLRGEQELERIAALVQKDSYGAAFVAARSLRTQARFREDARLTDLWRRMISPMRPRVAEADALFAFKPYDQPESEWIEVGAAPFEEWIDAPLGALRVRLTKPGFRAGYYVIANPGPSVESQGALRLVASVPLPMVSEGSLPDDMTLVPHTDMPVSLVGWSTRLMGSDQHDIPAFAIARTEVTNREFKEFVDAGGYDDPQWWQGLRFEESARELSWTQARARFVDSTNRPGPAQWRLSTYPQGTGDLPVGGVSWYEAVAYARFRGAELPTIHHWVRAAFSPYHARAMVSPAIALESRFSADGPATANAEIGLGPWGTYHMFGNVREWVWNRAGDNALALGGAWSEYYGQSLIAHAAQPMWRLPEYGLRLMRLLPGESIAPELLEPTRRVFDSWDPNRQPVSDERFAAMRFQFTTHHRAAVDVRRSTVASSELWTAEEITLTFDPPDTLQLYLVRPIKHDKPLQLIVYGPPADCCFARRPNRDVLEQLRINQFVLESGRALVMPLWFGSYETQEPYDVDPQIRADQERRRVLRWQQELASSLDYLESRPDIDLTQVGYFGLSQGAVYAGALNLALEPRVRAAVLVSGGLPMSRAYVQHPMIDITNYAPRIRIPVMMINGRFDHVYPLEQSQQRLFELLGAPASEKVHIVLDAGHFAFAPNTIAMHATDWFDRHLGAVR